MMSFGEAWLRRTSLDKRLVYFAIEGRIPTVGEKVFAQGPRTVSTCGRKAVGIVKSVWLTRSTVALCIVAVFGDVQLVADDDGCVSISPY